MPKGKDTLAVRFYLEPEQGAALKRLAALADRSLSAELRRAVRSHLDRSLAGPGKLTESVTEAAGSDAPLSGARVTPGPASEPVVRSPGTAADVAKRGAAAPRPTVPAPGSTPDTGPPDLLPAAPAKALAARTPGVKLGSEVAAVDLRRVSSAKELCPHRINRAVAICKACDRADGLKADRL